MLTLNKALLIFLIVLLGSSLALNFFNVPFGNENYFDHRGWFFLFFITLFPRLTLLFSSVKFGGFIWWLGWFFAPRVLVAILATVAYFKSNPILVTISWIIALSGEIFEKWSVTRPRFIFRYNRAHPSYRQETNSHRVNSNDTIEAEFKVKSED